MNGLEEMRKLISEGDIDVLRTLVKEMAEVIEPTWKPRRFTAVVPSVGQRSFRNGECGNVDMRASFWDGRCERQCAAQATVGLTEEPSCPVGQGGTEVQRSLRF